MLNEMHPEQQLVDNPVTTNTTNPEQKEAQEEYDKLFKFEIAKPFIERMITDFGTEERRTKTSRERRRVDIDIQAERQRGNLKQDETMIIDRVIDRNIAREKPAYIAFLQQAKRLVIFRDVLDPNIKHDQLESNFTQGMTYPGWIVEHYKCLDGAQAHGWDWVEVVYDETKPLHASIEHVGHDRLIFSADTEDIQNCAKVLRKYKLSKTQLNKFVQEFGFNQEQVDLVIGERKDSDAEDCTYDIYKKLCKYDNTVYVSWYSAKCTDWLKAPQPLYLGVKRQVVNMVEVPGMDIMTGMPMMQTQQQISWEPVYENEYPFVCLVYEELEEKELVKKTGRVFKDKYIQEAKTAGWSAYINGNVRASQFMASPKDAQAIASVGSANKLENITIKAGAITPVPLEFWNLPAPPPQMLEALQALDIKNASDTGQMTYVVQNKEGSRTTATEIQSAREDTSLLTSVQVTLYSSFVRECYTKVWRIVQSQAMQDLVMLLGTYTEVTNPVTGDIDYLFQNDQATIRRKYDIRAAGDVDVVQRQQLIAAMMQFWPVVQNTVIAGKFLAKMLRLQFAEDGEAWAQELQSTNTAMALLAQLTQVMKAALMNPQEIASVGPQEKQNLMMLVQACEQFLAQAQAQQGGNTTNGQQGANQTGESGMVSAPTNSESVQGTPRENAEFGQGA